MSLWAKVGGNSSTFLKEVSSLFITDEKALRVVPNSLRKALADEHIVFDAPELVGFDLTMLRSYH